MNIEEDLKQIALDAWNARALVCNNTVSTTKVSYVSFNGWWNDYKKKIFGLGFFANLNNS
jgi:hypothetical protein